MILRRALIFHNNFCRPFRAGFSARQFAIKDPSYRPAELCQRHSQGFCNNASKVEAEKTASVSCGRVNSDISNEQLSFVERAKLYGVNALLGYFTHKGGFDSSLKNLEVTRVEKGKVCCTIKAEPTLLNNFGKLHGGCTCLLVDVIGTMALLTTNPLKPGVSVDLNVNFLRAADAGELLNIEGVVLKTGKTLGFTRVTISSASSGKLIAEGRHTKAL